jgi:DNA polymerase-3 subunit delta'
VAARRETVSLFPSSDVVIGQAQAVHALTQAMKSDRLAHGLLFAGPAGVGKETCARGLARGLLCERRHTPDERLPFGCGQCRACRRVDAGTHPDVTVVLSEAEMVARGLGEPEGKARPSQDIKVDAIRGLAQTLQKRPYEGAKRVAIIVDAHRMNTQAQNALLKGLEEPSSTTVLVLLVPNIRAVLPTIASRCLRLRFAPLAPEALEAILVQRGITDAGARARGGASSVVDALADDDNVDANALADRLIGAIAQREQGVGLGDRLELAASLGKDRGEVDVVLAAALRKLKKSLRARHLEGLGGVDVDEVSALEAIWGARLDLQKNGAVQLVLEQLLLGAPPTVFALKRG